MAEANSTRTPLQAVPAIQQPSVFVEACEKHFGEHPQAVIEPLNCASDALYWLREIFHTIAAEAASNTSGYRIKHLAEAGAHLATDMGEFAGNHYEAMLDRLHDAGVIAGEKGGAE